MITAAGKRKAHVTEILANELAQHGGRCFFCHKQLHTPVWHHREGEVKEASISGLTQTGDLTGVGQELSRCSPAHTSCHNQHHRTGATRQVLEVRLAG